MRRFLVWTLGSLAALAVAILLVLIFPPTGWIAGKIEEVVAARTGYALDIGELDLDLLSGTPSATVSPLSVDGGQLPGLLDAGRAEIAIDLGAALGGDIVIERAVVADAEVRLQRTADGRTSWTPGAVDETVETTEPEGGEFTLPTIRELRIDDLDVVVDDEITGTEALLAVQASGSTLPGETPLRVAVEGRANGTPVQARLEVESPLQDAVTGGPVRLAMDASIDGAKIGVSGSVDDVATLGGADLTLQADVDSLDAVGTLLGRELPALDSATLSATLRSDAGGDNLAVRADGEVDGETIDVSLDLDTPLQDALAGEPAAFDLDAAVGGASVSAAGRVDDIRTLEGVDVDLDIDIGSFAAVERLTGIELPDLEPASLTTTLSTEGGTTVLEAEGAVDGAPVSATLAFESSVEGLLAGGPVTLDLEAAVGGTTVSLDGTVQDLATATGLDLALDADIGSLDAIETLLGQDLPDVEPASLTGTLLSEGDEIVVRRFDLATSGSTLQGDVRVNPTTVPPTLYANLISRRLDADALLAAFGIRSGEAAAEEVEEVVLDESANDRETIGPILSTEVLPVAALFDTVQGAVALRVEDLLYEAVPLNSFDVRADLSAERSLITLDEAALADGDVEGTLGLEPIEGRDGAVEAKLALQLSRVRVARFVPEIELLDDLGGPLGGQVELWMSGDSIASLAGSLDGGVSLLMGRGQLDALIVELAGLDLFQSIGDVLLPGDQAFSLRCAYASLLADGGTVSLDEFVIDSADTVFLARGTVDLGAETLDLALEPLPKDPSLISANTGVSIGGTFASPEIEVGSELPTRAVAAAALAVVAAPAAALLPFIGIGGGEDSGFCELEGALGGDAG